MTAFILVHGTTQAPAGWDLLAAELRRRGHSAAAVDLPTDKPDWPPADYAVTAAAQAGDAGDDRVVVAHSGAGVVLPGIAQEVGADLALRFLFHDCDQAAQHWALGTLRLFNPGPAVYQQSPAPLPAGVFGIAIVPDADRTLRPEWMRQAARERLGVEPIRIDAGHCPHVSQPATLAGLLTTLRERD